MWATLRRCRWFSGGVPACPLVWVGGRWEPRGETTKVWETHKVCKETNHGWFVSFHLLPLPPTNIQNASRHILPTSQKSAAPPTTSMPIPASTVSATQPLTSNRGMRSKHPTQCYGPQRLLERDRDQPSITPEPWGIPQLPLV